MTSERRRNDKSNGTTKSYGIDGVKLVMTHVGVLSCGQRYLDIGWDYSPIRRYKSTMRGRDYSSGSRASRLVLS